MNAFRRLFRDINGHVPDEGETAPVPSDCDPLRGDPYSEDVQRLIASLHGEGRP